MPQPSARTFLLFILMWLHLRICVSLYLRNCGTANLDAMTARQQHWRCSGKRSI